MTIFFGRGERRKAKLEARKTKLEKGQRAVKNYVVGASACGTEARSSSLPTRPESANRAAKGGGSG